MPEHKQVAPVSHTLPTKIDPSAASYETNMQKMAQLVAQVRNEEEEIREAGRSAAVLQQHQKGRLTARERIALLLDAGTELFELGIHAAHGMYREWGGTAAAGVIVGIGEIHRRNVMLIANDATVQGGAFFPMTAKKVIRAQNIALENHIPTIYLVDSSGVFLPLQDDVFPDQDDFGRVLRNNAVMSAKGIPQIAAILGPCEATGAFLPVLCDHLLMTESSSLFQAGPALVQEAIGQRVSPEDLGGAKVHAPFSGTADFREPDDESCLRRIRSLVEKMGFRQPAPFNRIKAEPPAYPSEEIYGIYDGGPAGQYDMREIIARIVDGSRFEEYRAEFGKTMICGYARIGGFAAGIVANQRTHAQQFSHQGQKRIEFGGVIYRESAEKAARFIMDCNQNLVPLVFLHDVTGFMVGRDAEGNGILRAGAKLMGTIANSVVPKISVIVGGSFGAGHYAMCGKACDPRFVFAWPSAKHSLMTGDSAVNTLAELKIQQLESSGKTLTEAERKTVRSALHDACAEHMDPRYGAARLWVDKIIDPMDTRDALIIALEAAALNPEVPKFNVGILQT
jgi:acetyl-CoA carboxylase carboxyltransferase component